MTPKSRIFKPNHEEPKYWWMGYILLPYGDYYSPTKEIATAKKGDILRFFNGSDVVIDHVALIDQDKLCDLLCRIRYGIPWRAALARWQSYAVLEGHGKNVISSEKCLWVVYDTGKSAESEVL